MESALIVTTACKGTQLLAELLKMSGITSISTAASGGDARRLLLETSFDLVVINAPLSDEYGHELAVFVVESSGAGVIILCKSERADLVSQKVEDAGVFVVEKPISRQLFFQSIKLMAASRRRMLGLKKENSKLRGKIEEIRLVDRAKCLLIQYLDMTEPEAHRAIEKEAMDRRVTRKEIAKEIVSRYEN